MGKPIVRGLCRHPAASLDATDVAGLLEAIVAHVPDLLDEAQSDLRTVLGTLVQVSAERPLGAVDLAWAAETLRERRSRRQPDPDGS